MLKREPLFSSFAVFMGKRKKQRVEIVILFGNDRNMFGILRMVRQKHSGAVRKRLKGLNLGIEFLC